MFTNAAKSNRDEWVYDFAVANLRNKALFFADTYNDFVDSGNESYDPVIKWSSTLRDRFQRGERIVYNDGNRIPSLFRPFVTKWHFAEVMMNDRLTRNHYEMFGADLRQPNQVICFSDAGSPKPFHILATDKLPNYQFTGPTQCLPLYRYTPDGQRVSNITEWGRRQFREHYGDDSITDEDIFAYIYAMLHDPAYQQRYEVDLRREFPRVYFQPDFGWWAQQGRALLDLHLGFETAEPWPLERQDKDGVKAGRAILRADGERKRIVLDEQTTLTNVPADAWWYQLGSRTAIEWVLDQYKERKPRDATIRERFNTYRFAEHKERVIELLARLCTVSVRTMRIVDLELDRWTEIDPDEGLELRPEFLAELLEQRAEIEAGTAVFYPAEEVYRELGLDDLRC